MNSVFRKTIKASGTLRGIALHSGVGVNLRFHPAPSGSGIQFHFLKGQTKTIVPVSLENVVSTGNAVTIQKDQAKISTIEHLMAALYALGITDCILEINNEEVPIMDGSSAPFVDKVLELGIQTFAETVEPVIIKSPIWVVEGDKYLVILPSDELKVTYHIDFPHPLLRGKSFSTSINSEILLNEILPARTFGFLKDVEALHARGLALGGSIDNAVVLTDTGFLNDSLRFENECIRHKVLDLFGDLAVMGRPFLGHIIANKAGHGLDISLGKCIMEKVSQDELQKRRDGNSLSNFTDTNTATASLPKLQQNSSKLAQ